VVFWLYYEENDFENLNNELAAPLLRRYLDDPDFRQNLVSRQPEIDQALEVHMAEAVVAARAKFAMRKPSPTTADLFSIMPPVRALDMLKFRKLRDLAGLTWRRPLDTRLHEVLT